MRKIISFMHISLDGFVAGPNGEMDWIKVDDEIFNFVEQRIARSHTALYGRITFDLMEGYWPTAADKPNPSRHDVAHSTWYRNAHKVVLTKSLHAAGTQVFPDRTFISENIAEQLNALKNADNDGEEEILLFGSPTATKALLQLDLIDGFWLFVNPIILGKGISLFDGVQEKMKLKLMGTRTFTSGVTELNYWVNKDA